MKNLKLIIAVISIIAMALISFVACSLMGGGSDTTDQGVEQIDSNTSQQGGEEDPQEGDDPSDPSSGEEEGEQIEPTTVIFRDKGFSPGLRLFPLLDKR